VLSISLCPSQDRLPYSYEVLDGAVPCSPERLSLFLDRVVAFPFLRFTVISVEMLNSTNMEILLSFLSGRVIESLGICLHCIQHGDSLLHTSPWIEGKSWDAASVDAFLPKWREKINSDMAVTVVASPKCGSGKTHFIREHLKSGNNSVASSDCSSIVIHEKSCVASLLSSLRRKFPVVQGKNSLHLSISFLPIDNEQFFGWLREINHFFFYVIALRTVYDPNTRASFSFSGDWRLFVELPGGINDDANSWLKRNVPIIALCGEFPEIKMSFVIGPDERRVCMYLRAHDNGTINRRYGNCANKRIVIVLDTSGSMQGTPYTDAKNNAVSVFDSHVVQGDVRCDRY
jgi:hypothetical protein